MFKSPRALPLDTVATRALGAAAAAVLLVAGMPAAQAQTTSTFTNFQPGQQWQQVQRDTIATLGAFPTNSGWSSAANLTLADTANNQFLWIDGGETVRYTFSDLIVGTTYDINLSFLYAGYRQNPGDTNIGQTALRISSDVMPTRTRLESLAVGCAEADPVCASFYRSAMSPTAVTWGSTVFTATDTSAYIDFSALGGGQSRVALDNVRVTVSAVPEPETYAMLLAGLGAIGFMSRRRRAAQA